jgi:hypothetical protein
MTAGCTREARLFEIGLRTEADLVVTSDIQAQLDPQPQGAALSGLTGQRKLPMAAGN